MRYEPFTPGVFFDLPDADYRSAPGVSQSWLKNIGPTAAHMREAIIRPEKGRSSAARLVGQLVHHRLLRPNDPPPLMSVRPDCYQPGSAEMRRWLKEQREAGRQVLDRDEWEMVVGCVDGIVRNERARMLFLVGQPEVSLFGNLVDLRGRPTWCKARIDFLTHGNVIPDCKTTSDVSKRKFRYEVWEWGYHVQAAWYLDLYNSLTDDVREVFALAAVEKRPPYLCRLFPMADRAIALGRSAYKKLLTRYNDCLEAEEWPSYEQQTTLDLPERAYESDEQEQEKVG